MKQIVLGLGILVGLVFLQGCFTNISGDPHYDVGYQKGHVYRLVNDVPGILFRGSLIKDLRSVSLITDARLGQYPLSNNETVVTIPKGTDILVTSVLLSHDIENGTQMLLQARIYSGPYKGTYANIDRISKIKRLEGGGMFSSLKTWDRELLEDETAPKLPLQTPAIITPAANAPVAPPSSAAGR
jgi:hypothetical protein